ncbi:nickel uptake transporter family protein [Sphingobium lactosutens]|uniref:Nickel uptake transporter family protein n=1 Tax=Sphingobium lactosutens DS20 TaxID=1331060 RepID=T0J4X1_9SPHN|nr:nickel uptake transporter family protein [Sphingobium lactosutens]EQB17014.1 nickel uptake transporter family protein [Sphingobium lactosutens DS20]
MKRWPLALLALITLPMAVQAHEIWVERDGNGPARIYLGEPGEALPEGGDPEFEKLQAPKLIGASDAAPVRKAGYIEVAAPAGDVRVTDDSVFDPWGEDGKKQGVIYYARAGRSEPKAILPLEIVPTAAGADSFTLMRDGKPVPAAKILAISPDKWSKNFVTNDRGRVSLPISAKGRYILSATQEESGDLMLRGAPVATIYHMTTISFVND